MGLKFAYRAVLLFHIHPSKARIFDPLSGNSHYDRELRKSQILAIIRDQQIFRGKYATVEHE